VILCLVFVTLRARSPRGEIPMALSYSASYFFVTLVRAAGAKLPEACESELPAKSVTQRRASAQFYCSIGEFAHGRLHKRSPSSSS